MVLRILDTPVAPVPSRAWVEDAWRNSPAISPDWWRENLGFSHSKLGADLREGGPIPATVCNLWLLGATQPLDVPQGVVVVRVGAEIPAPEWPCGVFVWEVPARCTEDEIHAKLCAMEAAVRQGQWEAYGIYDAQLADVATPRPLHLWLEWARNAAQVAWQRAKRPALRVILHPTNMLHTEALFAVNTRHREEAVAPLELAARLGLWWLSVPPAGRVSSSEATEPLQRLQRVAEAEQQLHQHLGGQWPHRQGQPMFSVLQALGQGRAPWPTAQVAQAWCANLWPQLEQDLMALQGGQAHRLLEAWRQLVPEVPTLGSVASGMALLAMIEALRARLPSALQAGAPDVVQAALLAAMPGGGGVVMPWHAGYEQLAEVPDVHDFGAFFV